MKKEFICPYCNDYLTGINFDDTENVEEMAVSVAEMDAFKCSCGAFFQIGLFDLQTNKPVKANDVEYYSWEK